MILWHFIHHFMQFSLFPFLHFLFSLHFNFFPSSHSNRVFCILNTEKFLVLAPPPWFFSTFSSHSCITVRMYLVAVLLLHFFLLCLFFFFLNTFPWIISSLSVFYTSIMRGNRKNNNVINLAIWQPMFWRSDAEPDPNIEKNGSGSSWSHWYQGQSIHRSCTVIDKEGKCTNRQKVKDLVSFRAKR